MNKVRALVILLYVLFTGNLVRGQIDSLHLFDSLRPQKLTEVVVIGNKTMDHLQEGKPLSSVEQHLAKSPEVDFVRRGGYAWEPMINSMSSERIVLTIDGMRIFGACTDRMDPMTSYVDVSNLSEATINSGQEAAEFGNCIGGGLDLVVSKPTFGTPGWRTSLETGFESVNQQKIIGAEIGRTSRRFSYSADVIFRNAENYKVGGGKEMQFSQFEKLNISLNAAYKIRHGEEIHVLVIFDEARDVGYPALPMDVSLARGLITSLTYHRPGLGSLTDWHTKVYYNNITHVMDDSKRPDVPIRMDMPGWSRTMGFFSEARLKKKQHHWLFKWDGFHNQSLAEMTMYPNEADQQPMFMLTWPDVRTTNSGFYVRDHIHLGDQFLEFAYRAGGEYTKVADLMGLESLQIFYPDMSSSRLRLVQSLNVTYHLEIKRVEVNMNLGYGDRTPSISEAYGFYLYNSNDNHDYIGNPNLKNEQSLSLSLGLEYRVEQSAFSIDINHSFLPNYILGFTDQNLSPMTIGAQGVRIYQNLAFANILGIAASYDYRIRRHWRFDLGVKFTRGVDNHADNLPFISPLSLNTGVHYLNKAFSANLYIEGALRQNQYNSAFGEDATPAYGLVNIDAGRNLRLSKNFLQVKLGVENLLDHRYYTFSDWNNLLRPGRNIYINISYSIL